MGNNTLEIKKIMRYLSGKNYLITTRKLIELHKEIARWNMTGITGAIIYGYPRTGKTKAITYLAKAFESDAGNNIPVVLWDITDHTPTEKNFYGSILKAIGLPEPSQRDTALVLKTRIVNTLTVVASETEMRTIILLIDEASELNIKDFIWLMDLYNALMHNDVLLITYMFGTYKLKAIKENLKSIGESQIVGRFMTKEYIFKGICSESELQQCLISLDQELSIPNLGDKKILLSEYFFPDAYQDGKFFSSDMLSIFWNAFISVKSKYNIPYDADIPMQYFMTSFKECLTTYGAGGINEKYFPEQKDLEACIIDSGYTETVCFTEKGNRNKSGKGA